MFRAIIWKEFREQGLIGLTLLVVGSALLVGAAAFADPPANSARPTDVFRYLGAGRLATLMLAVTAGVVCGGALFAAEREAGTATFLESLPISRFELWQAKLVAGVALAIAQIGAVETVSAALGLLSDPGWATSIASEAILAFAWGAFGSTFARTTLGSLGVAVPFAALAAFSYTVLVILVFGSSGGLPRGNGILAFFVLMLVTPLAGSAIVFTRPDRLRRIPASLASDRPKRVRGVAKADTSNTEARVPFWFRSQLGWRALLWLTARQLIAPALVISAFTLLFALFLITPSVQTALFWPALALSAGVLAGVTTFGNEQSKEVYRFWSQRRLPVGPLWSVKIGMHLLFLLGLLLLLALPSMLRWFWLPAASPFRAQTALGTIFRTRLFDELQLQAWLYLLAPAAYGFAAGHLCGLLFHKTVVAAGVAGVIGGSLSLFVLPSMLGGGVSNWQVWSPALVLLVMGRVVIRSWTTERLLERRSIRTIAAGCGLAVVLLAGGIAYRVLEVPARPNADSDIAFVGSLPAQFDRDNSGRLFVGAVTRFANMSGLTTAAGSRQGLMLATNTGANGPRRFNNDWLEHTLLHGWKSNTEAAAKPSVSGNELDAWLNDLFDRDHPQPPEESWYDQAVFAAGRSIGVFEDPRQIGVNHPLTSLDHARAMGTVLLVRGLQRQAQGDPTAFVKELDVVLALVKTIRNGSIVESFRASVTLERNALLATDRWLEAFKGSPELLRRVRDLWLTVDSPGPFDPTPYFLAERYVQREMSTSPSQWLPDLLLFVPEDKDAVDPEVDLVATTWSVPWERERSRRLLGQGFEYERRANASLIYGRPGSRLTLERAADPNRVEEIWKRIQTARRAMVIKIALKLFEITMGHAPESLDQLITAGDLRELPRDPYDEGQTFHYRVSKGENLDLVSSWGRAGTNTPRARSGDEKKSHAVPAGEGILWSIGPANATADSQRMLPPGDAIRLREDDFVFLVPQTKKP